VAKKRKEPGKGSFNRRSFLKTAGVSTGALTAGLLTPVEVLHAEQTVAAGGVVGPGAVPITLRINGQSHSLNLEPRVTLLDALRNHLDLTGAKRVCDRGECGACTVMIDGNPTYSCSVLAIEAQGRDIVTIESLSEGDRLHPLMSAFVENDAQQCGFCTPGFVMAAKAFLDKHPNATPAAVNTGLGGNFCRCGTYKGLREAVAATSKRTGVTTASPGELAWAVRNGKGGSANGGM
jgi:xanthine dehydrogenase YagT iron-sulfur-binding subunit